MKQRQIAEFLGWEEDEETNRFNTPFHAFPLDEKYLHFETSYEWQMEAVEKIEELGYAFNICQNDVEIYEHDSKSSLDTIIQVSEGSKKSSIYAAILEFIEWYDNEEDI